jgi:hypothetical protein
MVAAAEHNIGDACILASPHNIPVHGANNEVCVAVAVDVVRASHRAAAVVPASGAGDRHPAIR